MIVTKKIMWFGISGFTTAAFLFCGAFSSVALAYSVSPTSSVSSSSIGLFQPFQNFFTSITAVGTSDVSVNTGNSEATTTDNNVLDLVGNKLQSDFSGWFMNVTGGWNISGYAANITDDAVAGLTTIKGGIDWMITWLKDTLR